MKGHTWAGGALGYQVLSVSPPTLVRGLLVLGAQKPRRNGAGRGQTEARSCPRHSHPRVSQTHRALSVSLAEVLLRISSAQGSAPSLYDPCGRWEVFLDASLQCLLLWGQPRTFYSALSGGGLGSLPCPAYTISPPLPTLKALNSWSSPHFQPLRAKPEPKAKSSTRVRG